MSKKTTKESAITGAAYLRTATDRAEGFNSLKNQEKRIRAFAKSNNIIINQVYKDEGYSGLSKVSERPGLKKLYRDFRKNLFNMILVSSPDRLSRTEGISLLTKVTVQFPNGKLSKNINK